MADEGTGSRQGLQVIGRKFNSGILDSREIYFKNGGENLAELAPRDVTSASEGCVSNLLIDALAAAFMATGWYVWGSRYNRRKGMRALRWFEAACSVSGEVVESHWGNISQLHAKLRFAAHWFENAHVTIRLVPRPLPIQWLFSIWRKQKETLTFVGDLDGQHGLNLELLRHRWVTHKHIHTSTEAQHWTVSRPGPVILTTRTQWAQELTPVVNTLMTSRGHDLISVRFRRSSPHLEATVALDAITDEEAAIGFLGVLRELASSASAQRQ